MSKGHGFYFTYYLGLSDSISAESKVSVKVRWHKKTIFGSEVTYRAPVSSIALLR